MTQSMSIAPLHIVIATGEVMANLIPLIYASRNGEIEEVWVLVSDEMRERPARQHLVAAIEKFCNVDKVVIREGLDDSNPHEIEAFAKGISRIIATETNFQSVAYHATGGKKLHSHIFARVLEFETKLDVQILYSDGASGTLVDIVNLSNGGVVKVGDLLSTEEYLFAQGYESLTIDSANPKWTENYQLRKPFTDLLFRSFTAPTSRNKIKIGDFNRDFNTGERPIPLNPTYVGSYARSIFQNPLFKSVFSNVKVENESDSANSISLSGLTVGDSQYLSGRWFEELIYSWLTKDLTPLGATVSCGIQIRPIEKSTNAQNELDIVIYSNNNLAVIECKTSRFDSKLGNQTAYKTNDITKRITGAHTKAVVVSLQPIDQDTKRFRFDPRVAIYDISNIKNLTSDMIAWVKQTLA